MSNDIQCQSCGALYAFRPELVGRKIRCGQCGEVMFVEQPQEDDELELLDISTETAQPEAMGLDMGLMSVESDSQHGLDLAPEAPSSAHAPNLDEPDFSEPDFGEESDESGEATGIPQAESVDDSTCPSCGAAVEPTDTVCLACGFELGAGSEGIINQVLDRVPKPVLIGIGSALALIIVGWIGYSIYYSGLDDAAVLRGQELAEENNFRGAIKEFKQALEYNPANLDAIEGGVEAATKAKVKANLSFFNKRLRAIIGNDSYSIDEETAGQIAVDIAKSALKLEDHALASSALNTASKAGVRDSPDYQVTSAHRDFAKSDWKQAKKKYLELVKQNTDDTYVYLNLARISIAAKETTKAQDYITKAMSKAPAESNVELAKIAEAEKKFEDSMSYWQEAVEADGNLQTARAGLAKALARAKKYDEAKPHGLKATDLNPLDREAWETLAEIQFRLNELDPALASAEKALGINARVPSLTAKFIKGAVLIKMGIDNNDKVKIASGEKLLNASAKQRNNAEDYVAVAKLYASMNGRQKLALQWVRKALMLDPNNIQAHKLHIELNEQRNNINDLSRALTSALAAVPEDPDINLKMANFNWNNKRKDYKPEALKIYAKLVENFKDDAKYLYDYVKKLIEFADSRDELSDSERLEMYTEALDILEKDLRDRLKADIKDLDERIKYVQLQKLQLG